jgi:serine/threonine-protein kinase
MPEPTPGALAAGQVFHGRYEIVRCLRAGGMGAVYECIHLKTRKHRALKVMLPQILADAAMRDRFELEARVTADIESEHIVETFDAGVDEATGAPFLVMELLRGDDLRSIVKKRGALPASETVLLLSQAALALDKTHAAGVVHRDLKPDNLFVTTRDDGSPRLKVLDFGIAKVVADAGHTVQQTAMIGTPLYMAYEQILGEGTIGPGADIYAMGHIAFTLLTGEPYWADEQKASPAIYVFLGAVMQGAWEPATQRAARRGVALPAAFDAWFARATARVARDRFEGASAMVAALAGALGASVASRASVPLVAVGARGATVPVVEPLADSTPTVSEGTTLVATGKAGRRAASKRSWVLWAVVGVGAIGVVAVGVRSRGVGAKVPGTAVTVTVAVAASASASAPVVLPSVEAGVETMASAEVPAASAAMTAEEAAEGSTSSGDSPAVSAVAVPVIPPLPLPLPLRPRPAPVKRAAPAKVCEPPYVVNDAGRRVMKPECL